MKHKEKISRVLATAFVIGMLGSSVSAFAEEAKEVDEIAHQEVELEKEAKRPEYLDALKTKYSLTDEQIKSMSDKGMNHSQMTIAAQLAKSSEKPIEDIVKMRLDDKMGWGKIAKNLNVHPSEIGKGVSGMHRKDDSMHAEKREEKEAKHAEKRAEKEAKRAEKLEAKEEKKKMREERREEKREKQAMKKEERAERRQKKDEA